ncbi:13042_t:CDS:2 [Funneliformis mosseae]|uniref:13042_t:CDS:1 n=1 Tax=Funneliformis mosseae TaxID=27381 RepID=A0A9N8UYG1_FUNMO|nr:13042_t:CDS:2 [Funneliformis mosseae]
MNRNNSVTPGSPSPATLHNSLSLPISTDLSTSVISQQSWEYLRKQARQLENELEQKLTSYSKIAAQVGRSVGYGLGSKKNDGMAGNSSEAMELELEELIKKANIQAAKNHSDLLSSVREDIRQA